MADFENTHRKFLETQGEMISFNRDEVESEFILCSECFRDEGLKLDAYTIGIEDKNPCPNCNSNHGYKLTKKLTQELSYRFFVKGTIERLDYGGFPLIQFNNHHYNHSDIDVSPWLKNDIKLLENANEIGFFYYGPRFWMFGEIEPLHQLRNEKERNEVIDKILRVYPFRELTEKEYFYRIRINPQTPHLETEYDSAPDEFLGSNRFDESSFPILYASPDLELCIHECRVAAKDKIYAAKLVPKNKLKLLDLTALINEESTEFESLDLAIHFLFLAERYSYPICRQIAKKSKEFGYDGIIYPSYFSYLRTGQVPFETVLGMSIRHIPDLKEYAQSQSIPNVALFGRPVRENKLTVDCINKVILNRVSYDLSFGPAYHKAFQEDEYVEEKTSKFENEIKEILSKKK